MHVKSKLETHPIIQLRQGDTLRGQLTINPFLCSILVRTPETESAAQRQQCHLVPAVVSSPKSNSICDIQSRQFLRERDTLMICLDMQATSPKVLRSGHT
jgi:hypothetical protein